MPISFGQAYVELITKKHTITSLFDLDGKVTMIE
jgi:hypothetical protein